MPKVAKKSIRANNSTKKCGTNTSSHDLDLTTDWMSGEKAGQVLFKTPKSITKKRYQTRRTSIFLSDAAAQSLNLKNVVKESKSNCPSKFSPIKTRSKRLSMLATNNFDAQKLPDLNSKNLSKRKSIYQNKNKFSSSSTKPENKNHFISTKDQSTSFQYKSNKASKSSVKTPFVEHRVSTDNLDQSKLDTTVYSTPFKSIVNNFGTPLQDFHTPFNIPAVSATKYSTIKDSGLLQMECSPRVVLVRTPLLYSTPCSTPVPSSRRSKNKNVRRATRSARKSSITDLNKKHFQSISEDSELNCSAGDNSSHHVLSSLSEEPLASVKSSPQNTSKSSKSDSLLDCELPPDHNSYCTIL